MSETAERDLVARAGQGDVGAFADLCRAHGPTAWRFAQVLTRRQDAVAAAAAAAGLATAFGGAAPDDPADAEPTGTAEQTADATADAAAADAEPTAAEAEPTAEPTAPDPAGTPEPTAPAGRGPLAAVLAATREAAVVELRDADRADRPAERLPAAVRALHALPERWRALLWLVEVEELPADVAAAALDVPAGELDRLLAKVRAGYRSRALTAAAHDAEADRPETFGPACRRALAAVGEADGLATARPSAAAHLRRCWACRQALAVAESPGDELALWVAPLPATLFGAARRRWEDATAPAPDDDAVVADATSDPAGGLAATAPGAGARRRGLPGWARRAVAGGCAALLLVGVSSAVSFGADPLRGPEFAAPAFGAPFAAMPFEEADGGRGDLPRYDLSGGAPFQAAGATRATTYGPWPSTGTGALTSVGAAPGAAPATDAPAGGAPAPAPAPPATAPTGGPPATSPPPTSPPPTSPPPTSPPTTSPPPPPPADDTTVGGDVGGTDVGGSVGDCTGLEVGDTTVGCDPPEEEDPDVTVPPVTVP